MHGLHRSLLWTVAALSVVGLGVLFLRSTSGCGSDVAEMRVRLTIFDSVSRTPLRDALVAIVGDGKVVGDPSWLFAVEPTTDKARMEDVSHGLLARGTSDASGVCEMMYLEFRDSCMTVGEAVFGKSMESRPWGEVRGVCFVKCPGFRPSLLNLHEFTRSEGTDPGTVVLSLKQSVGLQRER